MMPDRMGTILVQKGLITPEQLDQALRYKLTSKKRLGEVLVEFGLLSKEQIVENLFEQLHDRIRYFLEPMEELESIMAEAYALCAELFPDQKACFEQLVRQETAHAAAVRKMIDIVYDKPDLFEVGLPLRREAVQLVIEWLKESMTRIRNGAAKKEAVILMIDIEKSLIENRFFDVLKSAEAEYGRFIQKLRQETYEHRKTLEGLSPT
jgi:hypothetical protein